MEYKTGSYIIRGRQQHRCLFCYKDINASFLHFARVKESGEPLTRADGMIYYKKEYYRYHLDCALSLPDLKNFEKLLIDNNRLIEKSPYKPFSTEVTSEKHLRKVFESLLKRYELQEKLSYIKVPQGLIKYPDNDRTYFTGKEGCSDLVVFLPKGRTIFVELKYGDKILSEPQIKFQSRINKIGHEYICVRDKKGISQFMNRLNEVI